MFRLFLSFIFILFVQDILAQPSGYLWLFLPERDLNQLMPVSESCLANRKKLGLPLFQLSDYGPSSKQLTELEAKGFEIVQKSRWLNAVVIKDSPENRLSLSSYAYNYKPTTVLTLVETSPLSFDKLGQGLTQMHVEVFLNQNRRGQGVKIGILDGGFQGIQTNPFTSELFENGRIKNYKDFFRQFEGLDQIAYEKGGSEHGTYVAAFIGGMDKRKDQVTRLGIADQADFYLGKTETSGSESRQEEFNWITALEWMDSLGVRLVNSSLGYATGFTCAEENYKPEDMDGKTTEISKAAGLAVREKGMILIVSAGNEGKNLAWKGLVTTPADTREVLSVGAVTETGLKADYSSVGRTDLDFIKPDVCVFSSNGTSFAAPLVTGVVAAILQQRPDIKMDELKEMLYGWGSLNPFPNHYLGYGELDLRKVVGKNKKHASLRIKKFLKVTKKNKVSQNVVIFDKVSATKVISQRIVSLSKEKPTLSKIPQSRFSTVMIRGKVFEIRW